MAEEFLVTRQLCEYCPWLTPAAVRNLVARRKIPFRKPGGRLIFIKSEIDGWIRDSSGVKLDQIKN